MNFFKWLFNKLCFWKKVDETGYDFIGHFSDAKIEKVVVYNSSDSGYFSEPNPTNHLFMAEGWTSEGWKKLKDDGSFQ